MPGVDSLASATHGFADTVVLPLDDEHGGDVEAANGEAPHPQVRALGRLDPLASVNRSGGQGLSAAELVQLCGGLGVYRDLPIPEIARERHPYRIGENLSAVRRRLIAEHAVREIAGSAR